MYQGKKENKVKGDVGELGAEEFLCSLGYVILKKNYKTKFGEIDIIAKDGDVLVFVEVKNRTTFAFGRPIEAVDERKQFQIRRVAEFFLMVTNQNYADCRFDVIEMLDNKFLNHVKDAF